MKTTLNEQERQSLLWFKQICDTNNDAFIPLFFTKKRYIVLKGGGGSGKSIFAGRYVLERVTTEPGHRWLVTRKVGRTLRHSCFEQLKTQAEQYYADKIEYIPKGENSDMYIKFKNGNIILFSGLDDVEKLKSIFDITGIWAEEASELEESDFNQLDIRLRTDFKYRLTFILSFNPIFITHWLKKRFFDKTDPRAVISETTYKDNRFLSEEAQKTLESFKDSDPYYYMVYALGQWGVTGKSIFNALQLSERLEQLKAPAARGLFEYTEEDNGICIRHPRFVSDASGPLKIFKEPQKGRPYVIGGDTAGDGSDWFCAQVLDNITGEQVCTLHHQYDEDTFAKQVYCIGKYYNNALVALETNFSTYPVKIMQLMGYDRLYVREVEDNYEGKTKHAYGFRTDKLTRPVIINEMIRVMRDRANLLNDDETILEMLTFVRDEKLRPAAEPGAHDDTVMALAIAYYIRPQQSMTVELEETKRTKWTADMWQDYNHASPSAREMLIQKWGSPR